MNPIAVAPAAHPRAARVAPGPWDGMVVLCAATSWGQLKLHDRNLAEALSAHAPVLYVNPPASHLTRFNDPTTAELLQRPRLRELAPRIASYTPLVLPKPMEPSVLPWTQRLVGRQLRGVVDELGGSVDTVISCWLFVDAFSIFAERRIGAYWWTDDPADAAALWGRDASRLVAGDERMSQRSDLVLSVSAEKTAELRERGIAASHLPNGCDAAAYLAVDTAPEPTDVALPGPIAGFVGHLNDRTDLALLEGIADDGTSLLVIGPRDDAFEPERFAALVARPNVQYLGRLPFAELAPYLRKIDVGVVPYADSLFNRNSFPLKMLEYLAAGLPVVSTPLPAVRWLNTELIDQASTPGEFAAAVRRLSPLRRDPALIAARRNVADEHSWSARANAAVELLGIESRPAEPAGR
jgi:teichuronic acid biosynthesis glycosyltransferase TuaH